MPNTPTGPANHAYKHGKYNTPEYQSWRAMKDRCRPDNLSMAYYYHRRGIYVCDRWLESFTNFLDDMGLKPSTGYTLERVDNNGPYSPENCIWATREAQSGNRSMQKILEFNGKRLSEAEWARLLNIPRTTIQARLRRGWSVERTLSYG